MPDRNDAGDAVEPLWPSDDRDTQGTTGAGEDGSTDELPVPNVTAPDAPTGDSAVAHPTPDESATVRVPLPERPERPSFGARDWFGRPVERPDHDSRQRPGEHAAPSPASPPGRPAPPPQPQGQVPPAVAHAPPMRIEPTGELRPAPATTATSPHQHPPQPPRPGPTPAPPGPAGHAGPGSHAGAAHGAGDLEATAYPEPGVATPPAGGPEWDAASETRLPPDRHPAPDRHSASGAPDPTGQQHAADPAGEPDPRQGAGVQEPAVQEPAVQERVEQRPRRRRRGLLVGALALVLVVAVGVVLALPDVSNRLGLPWAPNAPKADPPAPVAVTRVLHGPGSDAPAPTPAGVAGVLDPLAGAPALGTLTGRVVDPATGSVLWERSPHEVRTPASTTKVLVAAAALLAVDHGLRLPTRVVAGDQPGTVVLVAGGDVTLSSLPSGRTGAYPGAAHLDDLVEQVRASGADVDTVRLDLSAFAGPEVASGWAPEDVPSTYMAEVRPAMLDGGRADPTNAKSMRVADPAGRLAGELAERLGARAGEPTTAPPGATVLGEVRSAPLTELVDQMLTMSDNLLADVIARQVAVATGNEPSFAGGAKATIEVLGANGFDVSGLELSDGSGLSVHNRVSATLLSELLAVAAAPDDSDPRTAKLRPLVGGLPVAGGSGTLAGRYRTDPSDGGRGWVRAKTGTLSGVNTLAGVVLDRDGRVLVFALMSAGSSLDVAQPALDTMAAALRECGCR
ncbi:D-alanyl-D-alanine carboxypeptidase / D-alanyl-D-alanine-endopeptidase (penicillin-binding protein 4) [Amycolatopsis arida]|uniref:D-alanyl-D-alanine carboxypeptidase / D-alanyl-D-alanine-endopeptidase (Penicillin-binding protein 4) n=1 Tax=Amycolatopsis arida TaxID=587909 RepID=A0A1I5R7L7_9PSEU|nr:D-alanyl-D-alanine carboxypeptidase/D-alanyl-D-alanine-endopeptidase [Amycolatopsis arida]TDX99107.1 D-alanyl-D-alanine carboxypeptidase/D-alanyl-D-alanine-endopeptidase (penicillin-binding protein 4) [Amycolatopsis arida]SFP54400.1 D-alanyl-D-alanine carboxypeptidase / D-alanyl-D-alanine-endopeptidase (penicillin-binding protein 4) [Amycolatopsis arida]